MNEQQRKEHFYVGAVFLAIALTALVTMAACGAIPTNRWDMVNGLSAALYTAITAFILFVAAKQFKLYNDVAAADFSLKFKNDFFTEQTRELIMLIDYDQLEFAVSEEKFAYFKVKKKNTKDVSCHDFCTTLNNTEDPKYSSYQIDDLILNHLEDLSVFREKGALDIDYIYEGFSYFIETVYENEAINQYLIWLRHEASRDLYIGIDNLYHIVKAESKKRNPDETNGDKKADVMLEAGL
jgi:hypothetical protein